ncbi:Chromosomal replication initiator protein DnaA [compost metagenome]
MAQFLGEPAWEGCPRCLFDAAHAADPAISGPARAERQARRLNLDLLAVGLPLRFRSKTLTGYQADTEEQGQALDLCRAYAAQFQQNYQAGRSLMLLGSVGTGKTHLAAAIAVELVRMGAKVRYLLASELIRAIKATFGRDAARSEQQVYDEMLEPDLLIIDEIGVQHGTEFERNALFEVVNGRYGRMLPTLIISNLGPTELPACLGERVIDRFRENEGIAVVFRWPSARRAAP